LFRAKGFLAAATEFFNTIGALPSSLTRPRTVPLTKSGRSSDAAVNSFYEAVAAKGARVTNGAWFGDEVRVFRLGFGLLPLAELAIALDVLTASLREIADRSRVINTPRGPQATRT
jgi:hypothetical protein